MRVIKFRAWDPHKKRFLHDVAVCSNEVLVLAYEEDKFVQVYTDEQGYDNNKIIPEQYTGLKDKNGKEIYEGDIVEHRVSVVDHGRQSYQNRQIICDMIDFENLHSLYCLSTTNNLEIIGNIHENPELLS